MQNPNLRHSRFWSGFRLASVALVALPWKILEIRFREGRESGLNSLISIPRVARSSQPWAK